MGQPLIGAVATITDAVVDATVGNVRLPVDAGPRVSEVEIEEGRNQDREQCEKHLAEECVTGVHLFTRACTNQTKYCIISINM